MCRVQRLLFEEYTKYCKAGFGQIHFGAEIERPDHLLEENHGNYDVVIVASGKMALEPVSSFVRVVWAIRIVGLIWFISFIRITRRIGLS